jgi:hypothetical protein
VISSLIILDEVCLCFAGFLLACGRIVPQLGHFPFFFVQFSLLFINALKVTVNLNTVCSDVHTKHINTLSGGNVGFLHIKPGSMYNNHWDPKG